jgi:tetratricopeptide (TPR) repeat protein
MLGIHIARPLVAATLSVTLIGTAPRTIHAQSSGAASVAPLDSLRPQIETALVRGDWPALDRITARLRTIVATPAGRNDAWAHYDLAYSLHRRVSGLIADKSNARAKTLVEEALTAAERARTLGAGAHARALQGALSGQMAAVGGGLSPMRFGPRALSQLDEAIEAAPTDPRVALLNGMTRLNAPSMFGGGPPRAEAELRKAIRLFATDRNAAPLPNWGRADAHIWLGLALQAQNKRADARAEFDRALAITPGHRWIVETLIPDLERTR